INMRVHVAKAGPGETAFGAPVVAHASGPNTYDKPWVAFTQSGSIVITHTESDNATFSRATLLASKDGVTWNPPVPLPGASLRSLITLCASASTPRIFAAFVANGADTTIGLQWSDDDGAHWS